MSNCDILNVNDSKYKELLKKHNGNKKAALDEYLSSEASILEGSQLSLFDVDTPKKTTFEPKGIFSVEPKKGIPDDKAKAKASIATKYIGISKGISGSTALYARQAKGVANTGIYNEYDVVFVSIPGKRGYTKNPEQVNSNIAATINEVNKALQAGAVLITDNKSYTANSSYNLGEKRLSEHLIGLNVPYSEKIIDGHLLGVWNYRNIETRTSTTIGDEVVDLESTIIPHTSNVTEGFDVDQENYAINIITNFAAQTISNSQSITEDQVDSVKNPILKDYYSKVLKLNGSRLQDVESGNVDSIKDLTISFYKINVGINLKSMSNEHREFNNKVLKELNKPNSNLWSKVNNKLRMQYGYIITNTEGLLNENNELPVNWNENAQFKINPNDKLSAEIKLHINSTPDINPNLYTLDSNGKKIYEQKSDNYGGLPKTLNYKDVVPHLMDYLPEATSADDMMVKFKDLVDNKYPSLINLYHKLNKFENLKSLMFTNFYKPAPLRVASVITDKGIKTIYINKSGYSVYKLADNWARILKSNAYSNKYTKDFIKDQIQLSTELYEDILPTNNRNSKISKIVELFNNLGIEISNESIDFILDDKTNRDFVEIPVNLKSIYDRNPITKQLNLNVDELKELYIDNEILTNNVLNYYKYLYKFAKDNAYNTTKKPVLFDQYSTTLRLAESVRLFNAPVSNNSFINVNDEKEFSNNNPSFIDDFFTLKRDKEAFTNRLKLFALEPSNHFSNWLFGENGLLIVPEHLINGDGTLNINDDTVNQLTLNESVYDIFDYKFFSGVRNKTTRIGNDYVALSANDWDLISIDQFNSGAVESKDLDNQAAYFTPIASDRGNIRLINHYKLALNSDNYKNGNIVKNSNIYNAFKNTINQEIARMMQAADMVERAILDGDLANALLDGYHYIVEDGKKIFKDDKGNYTGSVFNFYNTDYIEGVNTKRSLNDVLNIDDIMNSSNPYLDDTINEKIHEHLEGFISSIISNELDIYKNNHQFINNNITNNTKAAITEQAINYYLANVEMINLFLGNAAFYGKPGKANNAMNKRATQLLASGNGNSGFNTDDSFTSITINEATLPISKLRDKIQQQLVKTLDKKDADRIANFYTNIHTGDGQSYITLDEFERRMKMAGLYKRYESTIKSLKDPNVITSPDDIKQFIQLQKNFYYGYDYDSQLNMNIPVQIKNSEFVLIPKFIQGSQLENLYDIMVRNGVDQINFKSAQKVGHRNIVKLLDGDLNIDDRGKLLDKEIETSKVTLRYQNLKRQQDIANHIKDTKNKLGSQIARLIISNINKPELVKEYFDILSTNIKADSKVLLSDLGITKVEDDYIVDESKLIKFLESEVIDRELNNNFIDGIKINDKGEVNIPLDFNIQRDKYISILTSLFTDRIVNQKFPGVHGPQLSNAFMNEAIDVTDKKVFTGIKDSKVHFRKLNYQHYDNGKFKHSEVLMPAWSKKFFGEEDTITIEDLKAAGLNTMIGYRIPTEDKHSVFVFDIVGFLDESQGSTIVVPDEFIAQTGSDFDIDSVYTMMYNSYKDRKGKINKYKYYSTNEEIWENRYQKTINFLGDLDNIISKEYEKGLFQEESAESKLLESILGSMPNEFTDDEINDILEEKGYSLELYNKLEAKIKTFPPKEDFMSNPVISNNDRKSRENRILDIYIEILSDPSTYEEMATASSFDDTIRATTESNSASGDVFEIINYNTRSGQREYRRRVLAGKLLKAFSVNRDGLNNISQITGVRINEKSAPIIKYDLKNISIETLNNIFGKENVSKDGTVRHTYLANDANGTFRNVLGRLVTSYSSQSTAHILDNVKFPLPKGVNGYTFKVWKLFADIGSTWEYGTKFIDQPIILTLSDHYAASNSAYTKSNKRIFESTKSDYQKLLIRLLAKNGDSTAKRLLRKSKSKGNLFIPKKDIDKAYKMFGYRLNSQTAFTEKQLERMLKYGNREAYKGLKDSDKINYLRDQLKLLENFIIYDNIAKELSDFNKATAVDKSPVGPTFENASSRMDTIFSLYEHGKYLHIKNESPIAYIYPKLISKAYGEEVLKDRNSVYPVLEDYVNEAFITPLQSLGEKFITSSYGFKFIKSQIGKFVSDNVSRKINDYTIAYGLKDLQFFNSKDDSKRKLLGINYDIQSPVDLDITILNDTNVDEFKNLPLPVKLTLIKDQYSELINDTSVLNAIHPVVDAAYIESNGRLGINFDSSIDDNVAIESFANLWYNSNPYLHLLAQDLVKYSYFVNGFSFGNNNISKIIPAQILYKSPKVIETKNGVDIIEGIGAVEEFNKFKLFNSNPTYASYMYDEEFIRNFYRANSGDPNIVPYVETKWVDDYIDPNHKIIAPNSPNFFLRKDSNIIILTPKQYTKLPIEAKHVPVLNIKYHRGTFDSSKVGLFVLSYDPAEDLYYLVPTTPLDNFEFSTTSYIPNNNVSHVNDNKSHKEYISEVSTFGYRRRIRELPNQYREVQLDKLELKKLNDESNLIINRSTVFYENLDLPESDAAITTINDKDYLVINLGYNIVDDNGSRRWQYAINTLPEYDDKLKAEVIEEVETPKAIQEIDSINNFIKDFIINFGKREVVFKNHELLKNTNKLLSGIDFVNMDNMKRALAINLNYNYSYRTIEALKRKLYGDNSFNSVDYFKDIATNADKQKELTTFLNYANTFIKGFKQIENLNTIKKDKLTESEIELNKSIVKLQTLVTDINELNSLINNLREHYFESVYSNLSTNPEVKRELRKILDTTDDESKAQLFLDAMSDTNSPFHANFVKQLTLNLGRANNEATSRKRDFISKLNSFKNKGYTIESLLSKDDNGNLTNEFIKEFDESYITDLSNLHDDLELALSNYGKYSKEYYIAEKKFNNWKSEIFEHETIQEVVDDRLRIQDILNSNFKARELYETIKEKERAILQQYSTSIDAIDITESDQIRLSNLRKELKRLASPFDGNIRKKGEDKEIAKTIRDFNAAMSEYNNKYKDIKPNSVFTKELAKHKESNTEESKRWLRDNTTIGYKSSAYDKLGEVLDILGSSNRDIEKSAILAEYKDEEGIINGIAVPKEVSDEIKSKDLEKYQEVDNNGNKTKGLLKGFKRVNNIVPTDNYRRILEDNGNSENDESRNTIIDAMNEILTKYSYDDGVDFANISIDDLKELIKLKDDLNINSGYNVIDPDRANWQHWYGNNHESVIDETAFRASESLASSKGERYKDLWDKLNTDIVIDTKYFEQLKSIAEEIFGVKSIDYVENEVSVDKLRGDLLLKSVGNVNSYDDLTDENKARIDKKIKHLISPVNNINLSSLINDGIHVIENEGGIPRNKVVIPNSIDNLQAVAKETYNSKKDTDRVIYYDKVDSISKLKTTDKYNELLELNGKDSKWYLDNHTLDYKGDIIPLPIWTITLPKDESLYDEKGADKRFWGYSKITSDKYIDEDKSSAKSWLNDNVEFTNTEYYDEALKSNKDNKEWLEANHIINPYTGRSEPISIWKQMKFTKEEHIDNYKPHSIWTEVKDKEEYLNPNYREVMGYQLPKTTSKYYNKSFDSIKDNELYLYLKDLLNDLVKHLPSDNNIINRGGLPVSFQSNAKDLSSIVKGIKRSIGLYDTYHPTVVGENNEIVKFLKLSYINPIINEPTLPEIERTDSMTDVEYIKLKQDRKKENEEIRIRNKQFQNANMNKDFESVISEFIKAATINKYKHEFEPEVKLALEQSKKLSITRKASILGRLTDKYAVKIAPESMLGVEDELAKSTGEGSNVHKHFEMFINMTFYDEFEANEGNLSKFARVIQNFTSAKGMWLNIPGAFNNVAYGKTQIALERFSGYFFNNSDRLSAEKDYWLATPELIANAKEDKSTTLTGALIKLMDVVELQDEQAITGNPEIDKTLVKGLLSSNTFYILHHMGEHYMQNVAMLSMMRSNRVVNGKIKSWAEYSFDFRYDALKNSLDGEQLEEFNNFVKDNRTKDKYLDGKSDLLRDYILQSDTDIQNKYLDHLDELVNKEKKSFETYPTLLDSYELVNGYAKIKEDINLSEDEVILFRRKVVKVNQKIHGIYNKFDANTIQHYALGRMSMQFRKWMRPGWNRRFGSKFGKKYWNESRNEYEQGSYITFARFILKPFIDNINKDSFKNEEYTIKKALKNIIKDYARYSKNVKLYWNTLDNSDKANVRRTLVEFSYAIGVIALGSVLRGIGDNDYRLKDSKNFAYILYLQDRLQSELRTYDPLFGWFNESKKLISSPFAATNTIEDMLSLAYTALFEDDATYRGGIYSKEGKLQVKAFKMLPIINRYLRYSNIEDYAGYFKLYSY